MTRALTLEELGLLHLLGRLERGTHVIDAIVRHGLIHQGLLLEGPRLELSDAGKQKLEALRAVCREVAAATAELATARKTSERRRVALIGGNDGADG